jgi:hypothetical protein
MTPDEIAQHLHARRAGRNKWMARCPAHDDRAPSLSIAVGRDGRTLLHCFAGCTFNDIAAAAGLRPREFSAQTATAPTRTCATRQAGPEDDQSNDERLHDDRRRLKRVVDTLAARLKRTTDGVSEKGPMYALFRETLGRLLKVEEDINRRANDRR